MFRQVFYYSRHPEASPINNRYSIVRTPNHAVLSIFLSDGCRSCIRPVWVVYERLCAIGMLMLFAYAVFLNNLE